MGGGACSLRYGTVPSGVVEDLLGEFGRTGNGDC